MKVLLKNFHKSFTNLSNTGRGGSRAAATSKMEFFEIIVNGFQPLTIITKCSILDAAAVLDPPLTRFQKNMNIANAEWIFDQKEYHIQNLR